MGMGRKRNWKEWEKPVRARKGTKILKGWYGQRRAGKTMERAGKDREKQGKERDRKSIEEKERYRKMWKTLERD